MAKLAQRGGVGKTIKDFTLTKISHGVPKKVAAIIKVSIAGIELQFHRTIDCHVSKVHSLLIYTATISTPAMHFLCPEKPEKKPPQVYMLCSLYCELLLCDIVT